ncbi:MAG: restriction endonuclease [Verrucomicrobia bacterium]|nr:restriction endonuclease [Verrucomicrobiota bacterium]
MLSNLTIPQLQKEAADFARIESKHSEPSLYGTDNGKKVGTYLEHKFQEHLKVRYKYVRGSSAEGIDFPQLEVDIKVTSSKQPQSSCPFDSARQKIYGLGYSLLVFVYDKHDDPKTRSANLEILHTVFVERERTADYQTTSGLRRLLDNNANEDDIVAFFEERMLPVEDIAARKLAEEVLKTPPGIGYLTISNALQWRLQYKRVIDEAGKVGGILRLV